MKIDFEMLNHSVDTFGWTKTVAIIRNGLEADIVTELECELVLGKLKAMFHQYNGYYIEKGHGWWFDFYNTAFDLTQRFSLERELVNESAFVADYNKREQRLESIGVPMVEEYPILTGEL